MHSKSRASIEENLHSHDLYSRKTSLVQAIAASDYCRMTSLVRVMVAPNWYVSASSVLTIENLDDFKFDPESPPALVVGSRQCERSLDNGCFR